MPAPMSLPPTKESIMSDRVLSIGEAVDLAAIVRCCRGASVARFNETTGDVTYGTARCIGDERGNFLADGEDVRDAYLRVTTVNGWEVFWKVSDLLPEVRSGYFVSDYRP
jgi:hypothetical protein